MSLQFILGNSGSGKTIYMYRQIVKEAAAHPDKNFLVIVPEQFTMQTQRELVDLAPNKAIMNIDVLSFQRLAYRVFDEIGMPEVRILEETGKNLALRKVAGELEEQLTVLRPNLNRMGYISEIKSLLSEFTQYNITPERLENFLDTGQASPVLEAKLRDILTVYRGFESFKQGKFITAEEILTVLCNVAAESVMLKNCVILFDEFTGFTPIQNQLLRCLLPLAERMTVSLSIDAKEDLYRCTGGQELFAMSKKTIAALLRMAEDLSIDVEEPILLSGGEKKRFAKAHSLFFMEQNLFRSTHRQSKKAPSEIQIDRMKNPKEELHFAARKINDLVRKEGYRYKDIAVVSGAVDVYGNYVEEIFGKYEIPYFLDTTKEILFHPFIELIRALLELVQTDFSCGSVFRFLRCGFTELSEDEIDIMENYVLAVGIRGSAAWGKRWLRMPKDSRGMDLGKLELLRRSVYELLAPVVMEFEKKGHTVRDDIWEIYHLLKTLRAEEQLWEREKEFLEKGLQSKSREYGQIYRIVMDLFDKIVSLLGDESMDVEELGEILDAGFDAAKVAALPPGYDSVTVGDIERTRISHVKILFFMGVNDGIIPKSANPGGIISQYDRERMEEAELELAPGARERVFIQRFYLYLNLTKPSERLYITYAGVDSDGKAQRASYLIHTVCRMFPALEITDHEELGQIPDFSTAASAKDYLVSGEKDRAWLALARWFLEKADEKNKKDAIRILEASDAEYVQEPISRAVAQAVYGRNIEGSVTRLERFAGCAYAHFLQYGLRLRERELSSFENADMGNLYHEALEIYSRKVGASDFDWFTIPEELQSAFAKEAMEEAIASYPNLSIYASAGNEHQAERMARILQRTVWALTKQVRKGDFVPKDFEVSFSQTEDLEAVHFLLQEGERMCLRGRIDRTDTCSEQGRILVKVIDYKSGNTSFDLVRLYYGLQMQLPVYMNAAMELERKAHPDSEVVCGGILYYHIDDPVIEAEGEISQEEYEAAVLKALRADGLVNREEAVYRAMDRDFEGRSDVIPVELTKSGAIYEGRSHVADAKEFETLLEYTDGMIAQIGEEIYKGNVAVSPYRFGQESSCNYCPYHSVCGLDFKIPGFLFRNLEGLSKEEALERMETSNAVWQSGQLTHKTSQ